MLKEQISIFDKLKVKLIDDCISLRHLYEVYNITLYI